jgi:hypothetical protein
MRVHPIKSFAALSMLMLGTIGIAIADDAAPRKDMHKFDGIWIGKDTASHDNVVLIKQFESATFMYGVDSKSATSVKCSVQGDKMRCRGNLTNDDGEATYESTVTFKNNELTESWKATFANELTRSGTDTFVRLPANTAR